jgi:hypothetical protein
MREEPKSLAEWLESKGNPKHSIAEGENGSMILVVDDSSSLENGITIFGFREHDFGDHKSFWISSGWGLRKEYLPALKKFLNEDDNIQNTPDDYRDYDVVAWVDDEEGEGEVVIETIKALSDVHADMILKNGASNGKYPKGAWVEKKVKKAVTA